MLSLSVLLYWNGVRSVEMLLRSDVESDAEKIERGIETNLRERELGMVALANSAALQDYVFGGKAELAQTAKGRGELKPFAESGLPSSTVPAKVQNEVRAFLLGKPRRYVSLTCLSAARAPLFRAEPVAGEAGKTEVRFQTEGFVASALAADERVWTTAEQTPLRSPIAKGSPDATIRYSVPVFAPAEDGITPKPRGVLIAELNGDELFDEAASARSDEAQPRSRSSAQASAQRFVIILDQSGHILYHTNEALRHQPVNSLMPASFKETSAAMMAGESGWKFHEMDGARWLLAYRPVASLGLSVGVGGNYTSAVRRVQPWGWLTILLSALFGILTVVVLIRVVRHTARSIERVTEGAVAIAGGKLDQRIEVRSSDEIRLLAESFNTMTDKLREQIARETESRQFESFMRLSAMLTHDLKNAIASLSLLVSNMERQFHREEFRADAMKSLTEATNKLRALVAKLSEPVQSLSSEHQMPRPTDLVPVIKRVLKAMVEPVRGMHEIEVQLPETLTAAVEVERIEKVFENLILNALEAMGQKSGRLTIAAGPTAHDEVFFSVADTGPGMSEEFQRTKLFRAFATTKRRGVGLGLYTCREIVRAHRGHIDVESKRGSGTTFRVVLPSEQKIT
ncbi:MAG TPA: ATP-binding protein [Pyrinomonadaceae bacterium]